MSVFVVILLNRKFFLMVLLSIGKISKDDQALIMVIVIR